MQRYPMMPYLGKGHRTSAHRPECQFAAMPHHAIRVLAVSRVNHI
jgi:hypothetical protein